MLPDLNLDAKDKLSTHPNIAHNDTGVYPLVTQTTLATGAEKQRAALTIKMVNSSAQVAREAWTSRLLAGKTGCSVLDDIRGNGGSDGDDGGGGEDLPMSAAFWGGTGVKRSSAPALMVRCPPASDRSAAIKVSAAQRKHASRRLSCLAPPTTSSSTAVEYYSDEPLSGDLTFDGPEGDFFGYGLARDAGQSGMRASHNALKQRASFRQMLSCSDIEGGQGDSGIDGGGSYSAGRQRGRSAAEYSADRGGDGGGWEASAAAATAAAAGRDLPLAYCF